MRLVIASISILSGAFALPTIAPTGPPLKHGLNNRNSSYPDKGINQTAQQGFSQEHASKHNLPQGNPNSILKAFPIPLSTNQSPYPNITHNASSQTKLNDFLNDLLALEAAESAYKPTPSNSTNTIISLSPRDTESPSPAYLHLTTYALPSCAGPGTNTSITYHQYVPGQIVSYYVDRDLTVDEELDFFTFVPGNEEDPCAQFVNIGEVMAPSGGRTQAMPKGCHEVGEVVSCFEVWGYGKE